MTIKCSLLLLTISVVISLNSCKSEKSIRIKNSGINKDSDCILISCLRCDCIIDLIKKASEKEPALLNSYSIWGDSTCLSEIKSLVRINHLSQTAIDSISPEIYNMVILKKNKTNGRLITTEIAKKEKMNVFK